MKRLKNYLKKVIELVSANKLKNDFTKYENDEIKNFTGKECELYIESAVSELFKYYKNGEISGILPDVDAESIYDGLKKLSEIHKNSNVDTVIYDRKFRYVNTAYSTAYTLINHYKSNERHFLFRMYYTELISKFEMLHMLLYIYHGNYSNYRLINNLMFNLSTVENLDITFEIHEKYLNNEYGVNNFLIADLDYFIKSTVAEILEIFDKVETIFDVNAIADEDYLNNAISHSKDHLKNILSYIDTEFEKKALIDSGYIDAQYTIIESIKDEKDEFDSYIDVKNKFLKLYNGNGFAVVSEFMFEKSKGKYDNFDDFMKYEPKYDLKECKLIKPEKERIAY